MDIRKLIDRDIHNIIALDLPVLTGQIATVYERIFEETILNRMQAWREGGITTINQMADLMKMDLSKVNLREKLEADTQYNEEIGHWIADIAGNDIALKLQSICQKK